MTAFVQLLLGVGAALLLGLVEPGCRAVYPRVWWMCAIGACTALLLQAPFLPNTLRQLTHALEQLDAQNQRTAAAEQLEASKASKAK